jgi:hypothetical protein
MNQPLPRKAGNSIEGQFLSPPYGHFENRSVARTGNPLVGAARP